MASGLAAPLGFRPLGAGPAGARAPLITQPADARHNTPRGVHFFRSIAAHVSPVLFAYPDRPHPVFRYDSQRHLARAIPPLSPHPLLHPFSTAPFASS